MSFQTFLKEIEKGFPSPVYVFYASDPFFHKEAIDAIKSAIPETERDFNLHIFDLSLSGDENVTIEKIISVVNTGSFFGGRRFTVLLGNLQKLTKKDLEQLNVYISGPAPNSVFILLHTGVFSKEGRDKFRTLRPVALDIRESEMPDWIKQRARIKGIELSDDVSEYLIGLIGPEIGLLSAELDKLALLGKKGININDIHDIVTGMRLYGIFDLVNALKAKNAEKVFSVYKTLRDNADDYSLIGALNWHYGRNLQSTRNYSEDEYCLKVFELLNKIDIDIKSSGRTFPMEYLLIKLLRLKEGHLPSL